MQVAFGKVRFNRHRTTCLLLGQLPCRSQSPQLANAQEQAGKQLGNFRKKNSGVFRCFSRIRWCLARNLDNLNFQLKRPSLAVDLVLCVEAAVGAAKVYAVGEAGVTAPAKLCKNTH